MTRQLKEIFKEFDKNFDVLYYEFDGTPVYSGDRDGEVERKIREIYRQRKNPYAYERFLGADEDYPFGEVW